MSSIGTGYDQSTTTFSPDGRVFQVEYAMKAVDTSSTAIGIRCSDGVALAVEKPMLSKMLVESSNRRILTVDKHSGMCVSGLMADARQARGHTPCLNRQPQCAMITFRPTLISRIRLDHKNMRRPVQASPDVVTCYRTPGKRGLMRSCIICICRL